MRLLCVSASPLHCYAIQRLPFQKAIVSIATTWKQVLEALEGSPIDVMILDFTITAINAPALISYLKKTRSKTFKILILMPSYAIELVHALLALGVEGFVSIRADAKVVQQAIEAVASGQIVFPSEYNDALHGHIHDGTTIDLDFSTVDIEIIRLTANGLTSNEIAKALAYTVRTVETKKHRIMQKLHAATSAHLVSKAGAYGLLG